MCYRDVCVKKEKTLNLDLSVTELFKQKYCDTLGLLIFRIENAS